MNVTYSIIYEYLMDLLKYKSILDNVVIFSFSFTRNPFEWNSEVRNDEWIDR